MAFTDLHEELEEMFGRLVVPELGRLDDMRVVWGPDAQAEYRANRTPEQQAYYRAYLRAWRAGQSEEAKEADRARRREKEPTPEQRQKRNANKKQWAEAFKARDPEGYKAYKAEEWRRYKERLRVRQGASDRDVVDGAAEVSREADARQATVGLVRG